MGVRSNPSATVAEIITSAGGTAAAISRHRLPVASDNSVAIAYKTIITRNSSGNAVPWTTDSTTDPIGIVTGIYSGANSTGGETECPRDNVLPAATAGSVEFAAFADGFGLRCSEDGVGGVIPAASLSGWADIIPQTILGNAGNNMFREPVATCVVDSSTFATSAGSLKWAVTRVVSFATVSIGGTGTDYGVFDLSPVSYQTP